MKKTELESGIEALLFYAGEIIARNRLCDICQAQEEDLSLAVKSLNEHYVRTNSGISIIEVQDGYQMCTSPQHLQLIQAYRQKPAKTILTQALIETLAIIAYSQPITRTQIEEIRGVRCEHAMGKLMDFNLIEEVGRLNVIGRPLLFGTTPEFLRHFGFKNLEEMPKIKEELVEKFKNEIKAEMGYYEEELEENLSEQLDIDTLIKNSEQDE